MPSSELQVAIDRIVAFSEARNWKQFHNPKDLAISLSLEAGEVLEHMQWKTPQEIEEYVKTHKGSIAEELADVFYWVLLMSHYMEIDILKALDKKMDLNELKYPQEKSKDNHRKYTEL